jgi:hypothetical protein
MTYYDLSDRYFYFAKGLADIYKDVESDVEQFRCDGLKTDRRSYRAVKDHAYRLYLLGEKLRELSCITETLLSSMEEYFEAFAEIYDH